MVILPFQKVFWIAGSLINFEKKMTLTVLTVHPILLSLIKKYKSTNVIVIIINIIIISSLPSSLSWWLWLCTSINVNSHCESIHQREIENWICSSESLKGYLLIKHFEHFIFPCALSSDVWRHHSLWFVIYDWFVNYDGW